MNLRPRTPRMPRFSGSLRRRLFRTLLTKPRSRHGCVLISTSSSRVSLLLARLCAVSKKVRPQPRRARICDFRLWTRSIALVTMPFSNGRSLIKFTILEIIYHGSSARQFLRQRNGVVSMTTSTASLRCWALCYVTTVSRQWWRPGEHLFLLVAGSGVRRYHQNLLAAQSYMAAAAIFRKQLSHAPASALMLSVTQLHLSHFW